MPMTVRDLIKQMKGIGWYQVPGGKGSHRKFNHPTMKNVIIVNGHDYDTLKPGSESDLKKQAGLQ